VRGGRAVGHALAAGEARSGGPEGGGEARGDGDEPEAAGG
jgi:hypothetical protein